MMMLLLMMMIVVLVMVTMVDWLSVGGDRMRPMLVEPMMMVLMMKTMLNCLHCLNCAVVLLVASRSVS
jgi:hypothetical protein